MDTSRPSIGGQTYGGTAEPDLIALAFLVFGQAEWSPSSW